MHIYKEVFSLVLKNKELLELKLKDLYDPFEKYPLGHINDIDIDFSDNKSIHKYLQKRIEYNETHTKILEQPFAINRNNKIVEVRDDKIRMLHFFLHFVLYKSYGLNIDLKSSLENNTNVKFISNNQKSQELSYENPLLQFIFTTVQKYTTLNEIWLFILMQICDDMQYYEFDKISSLNYPHKFNIEVETLQKTTLLQHTYNLVYLYDLNKKKETFNFVNNFTSLEVLFSSILHDFGKSQKIAKELHLSENNNSVYHSFISMKYIKKILLNKIRSKYKNHNRLDQVEKHLNSIADAVYRHHNHSHDENDLATCVSNIDRKAREYEVKLNQE